MGPAGVEAVPGGRDCHDARPTNGSGMARPMLERRVCATGGWNYGDSSEFSATICRPTFPRRRSRFWRCRIAATSRSFGRSLDYLERHTENHPSSRALALSALALKRHGCSTTRVEAQLRRWLRSASDIGCGVDRDGAVRAASRRRRRVRSLGQTRSWRGLQQSRQSRVLIGDRCLNPAELSEGWLCDRGWIGGECDGVHPEGQRRGSEPQEHEHVPVPEPGTLVLEASGVTIAVRENFENAKRTTTCCPA